MRDVSIANRSEPRRFADIVGQQQTIGTLRTYVEKPSLRPPTLLFSGPPGVGKTTTARVLSRALNCERFAGDVCGECRLCVHGGAFAGTLLEVDGSVDRGVEAMKQIRSWTESAHNVSCSMVLIDEAHALTPDAWNALLKWLERGGQVLWTLTTNFPEKLSEAVRSRSTPMEFVVATAEEMRPALLRIREVEGLMLTTEQIDTAIRASRGAMRDAVKGMIALEAGIPINSTPDDVIRRALTLSEEGNVGAGIRLLSQRVKETRDARQVFDEVVEALMEPLRTTSTYDAWLGFLLARLAGQRTGVARGMADETAVRLLPNLIWRARNGEEVFAGASDPQSESSASEPTITGCPTPTPARFGKGGRPYGAKPCGRDTCPWCGIRKSDDLHAAISRTRPPVRVSLTLPPWTSDGRDKRMDRVLSKFGESLHCWYEREVLGDGRIIIDCWMRPKDEERELSESRFRKALGGLAERVDLRWLLLEQDDDYADFLSELRSSWRLAADAAQRALETWVARNGAQVIHASHEFFLDEHGQSQRKKEARRAVSVE